MTSSLNGLRDVTRTDQPQKFVAEVGNRIEHERTAAVDHGNAVATSVCRSRGADAALAVTPMHPHVLDAEIGALSHRALRFVGRGGDDDGLNSSGDAPQV